MSSSERRPRARRKMLPRNLRLRSMRTYRMFFWSYSNSTHEPRYGMILPRKYVRLFAVSKNTPGERCNWLTITRSVPLMMNVPFCVIRGTSPKKTSCSFMSRIDLLPVSGSLSKMVNRMVTFNGAEYVMPRSSHSATSYFNCKPTGSPHLLQKSGVLALYVPHLVQSTSPRWNGSVFTVDPQFRQVVRRWFSPFRWPHLHSQLPIANSTKSSCATLRKSVIGNTDWNTACNPESSRSLGSESICRKRSYERFCTSMRFGIW